MGGVVTYERLKSLRKEDRGSVGVSPGKKPVRCGNMAAAFRASLYGVDVPCNRNFMDGVGR